MMKLEEFAEINMGQSPESSSYNENKDGLPFFQGKADFGKINPKAKVWCNKPTKIAEKDDILMSVRAPVGDLNIANEKCCIGRGLAGIRANKTKCYYKFLYYFLKSKYNELNQMATGSTFKAINKNSLLAIEGNIPDFKEQEAIVKKLDKIQSLIDLKEEQIEDLNRLIKSQFQTMFENNNYEKKTLNEISIIKGEYGSGASAGDYLQGQPRYVRITDIKEDGTLDPQSLSSPKNEKNIDKYILKYGDLLFARTGATVGKAYMYNESDGYCIYAGYCIRFRLDLKICNPDYIFIYTKTDNYKKWVENKQRVVAQPNINAKEYGNDLKIPIPPIELQNKFTKFVLKINSQKNEILKDIVELNKLQENLMNKYFN